MTRGAGVVAGWRRGLKLPPTQKLPQWAEKHVPLVDGRAPFYDLDAAPFGEGPMLSLSDVETRLVVLLWCTGSGKSALFEAWFPWIVSHQPGTILCVHPNEMTSRRWVEKRVQPTLEACEATAGMVASLSRSKRRKMDLIFPHMSMHFGGCAPAGLQDISVVYALLQEAWIAPPGSIAQLKARTHDRWNHKVVLAGQAGDEGSEYHAEVGACDLWDWQYRCPGCRRYAPPLATDADPRDAFEQSVSWDRDLADQEDADWRRVARSVRLVTQCCGRRYADTPARRRQLSSRSKYRLVREGGVPGQVCYRVTALSLPHVPWSRLVREYVAAKRLEDAGDSTGMAAFVQKRLVRWWEPRLDVPTIATDQSPYRKSDYAPPQGGAAPRIEDEAGRLMAIDVQKWHYWCVIRAFRVDGSSMLLWEGKVETGEGLRRLQSRYEVPNTSVGIDCGYDLDRVAGLVIRYEHARKGKPPQRWYMLKGEDSKGYPVPGRKYYRPYSNYVRGYTARNQQYSAIKHANIMVKDALAGRIAAPDVYFGVPVDHSQDYAEHMRSEYKTESGKWEKVKTKGRNDLWDCECMVLVLACIKRLVHVERTEQ